MRLALFLALLVGLGNVAHATEEDETMERFVVVLGNFEDFHAAHRRALALSHTSGMPFSMEGMVFDKARGLIVPDDAPDEVYAGGYILRRENTRPLSDGGAFVEYLSIERSEAYDGPVGGYFIVGGIYDDAASAQRALARFQPLAKAATVQRTRMYMGCMH
jgi:hypothetical protein